MRRFTRFLLPIAFIMMLLLPTRAYAGGYINLGTQESPSGSGATSGGGSFSTGEWIYLYAEAYDGYQFDHWEIINTANDAVLYTLYDPNPGFGTDGLADIDLWAIAYFKPVGHVHAFDQVDGKYPTCTESGLIFPYHYYCPLCGKHYAPDGTTVLSQSEWELPALGHSWYQSGITEATCINNGLREYTCSECGDTYYESIPATGIHTWSEWSVITPASCETDGTRWRHCVVYGCDGEQYEGIPATGHVWDGGKMTKEPAVGVPGEYTYTCTVCGATKVEKTPALKASYGIWTFAYPTSGGTVTGGGTFVESSECTITATPAPGYAFSHWQDGLGRHFSSVANYTFNVWEEWHLTAVFTHVHTWSDIAYKAPTCTEDGYAAYSICTSCELIVDSPSAMDVYDSIPVIPATGHSWGSWKNSKAAACTESGTESRTCTACGDIETRTVAALGHAWDEGKVTTEPTEAAEGVRTFTCTLCKETKTETIPKKEKSEPTPAPTPTPTPSPEPAPSPDPAPEPAANTGLPVPLIAAGAVGCVALGGLIVLLIMRKHDEDESDRPSHMR